MVSSVGFSGTQKGMTPDQYRVVSNLLHSDLRPKHVHHGDCIGSDAEFHDIARYFEGIIIHIHPPTSHKKRAYCTGDVNYLSDNYLKRNKNIVRMSDVLIATPHGADQELRSGTWSTVRYARLKGIPIYIVNPDGSIVFEPGHSLAHA